MNSQERADAMAAISATIDNQLRAKGILPTVSVMNKARDIDAERKARATADAHNGSHAARSMNAANASYFGKRAA
jgi:hypothetical protein